MPFELSLLFISNFRRRNDWKGTNLIMISYLKGRKERDSEKKASNCTKNTPAAVVVLCYMAKLCGWDA